MGFEALIEKVRQAEHALEAKERQTAADARQLRSAWRALWTPGRIVLAGLVGGFIVGRSEPFKKATGKGALQLINLLSGLLAGSSVKAAAEAAEEANDAAEAAESRQPEPPPDGAAAADSKASQVSPHEMPEAFRDRGHL